MTPLKKINRSIPSEVNIESLKDAVMSFVAESSANETGASEVGLYQQTIENIAASTIYKQDESRQLWLYWDSEGKVLSYLLAHVSKDVDNQLCYWVTQAWVHDSLKGSSIVKEGYQQLQEEAKRLLCKHIIVPTSRNPKSFCRFLGSDWHTYVTLIKKDL